MSLTLMRAARPLRMAPTDKAVLMALADAARDATDPDSPCQCWLPMTGRNGKLGLTDITCLSVRAVQIALRRLVEDDHITRAERPGRGVVYTVHPRTTCTPARDAPPHDMHPAPDAGAQEMRGTPARRAPKALITTITVLDTRTRGAGEVVPDLPAGTDPARWFEFADMRAVMAKGHKGRPWTAGVQAAALRTLAKLAEQGNQPDAVLHQSVLNGWQGLFPERQPNPGTRAPGGWHDRPSGPIEARRRDRQRHDVESGPGDGGLDDPS